MKKTFAGFLGMVVVFSMCATTVFATGPKGGRNFVDVDSDGICDNINSRCIYTDADGDGICDNCGAYHWCGMTGVDGGNFVDADDDGVCDNYASGQGRRRCGNGFRGGRCR